MTECQRILLPVYKHFMPSLSGGLGAVVPSFFCYNTATNPGCRVGGWN